MKKTAIFYWMLAALDLWSLVTSHATWLSVAGWIGFVGCSLAGIFFWRLKQ